MLLEHCVAPKHVLDIDARFLPQRVLVYEYVYNSVCIVSRLLEWMTEPVNQYFCINACDLRSNIFKPVS